jgi:hypothetical protein
VTKRNVTDLIALRLQFAVLVARPGSHALLITAENNGDGWAPLPIAVRTGRAFAVDVLTTCSLSTKTSPEVIFLTISSSHSG